VVIKKGQANFDNGVTYDVIHYETQAVQVKILDGSGNPTSDLHEMLFNGKLLTAQDLNTIKTSGKYRVVGGTNLPVGMVLTNTYILTVDAIDIGSGVIVAHQHFYDHINHETYHRTINGATFGTWIKLGKSLADQVAKIGTLSTLKTTQKASLVESINEIFTTQSGSTLQTEVDALDSKIDTHLHDGRYLLITGGSLTGEVSVPNNKSFLGKNTSGTNVGIAKIDGVNNVVLGSVANKVVLQASGHDISVSNGTTTHKVFHSGNQGVGSGLNAETVDGIDGSQIARLDINNHFLNDQFVENGKAIVLKAPVGSESAGSIYFRNGANENKARILVQSGGDLSIFANDINGHTFRSDGSLFSTYSHVMNVTGREIQLKWQNGSADQGMGFYMNNNTNQVGLWDWESGKQIFSTNRADATIKFTNAPDIQGHKLSIQTGTPLSPAIGDVWIDI